VLRAAERAGDPALTRLRERLAVVYADASRKRWAEHGIDSGRADRALVTLFFAMTESLVQATWDGEPPDQEALIDLLTEFTVGGAFVGLRADDQLADPLPDPFRRDDRVLLGRRRQQCDELLAAEPADQVVRPRLLPDHGGHRLEHVVPREVPVGVVDPLEVVEV